MNFLVIWAYAFFLLLLPLSIHMECECYIRCKDSSVFFIGHLELLHKLFCMP